MKKKIPLPLAVLLICFVLGSLSAKIVGDAPKKPLIDSVTVKIDSVTTIKIIINARGN